MKIYTDIDYVLHDYTNSFIKSLKKYLMEEKPTPSNQNNFLDVDLHQYSSKMPLDKFVKNFNLSDETFYQLINDADKHTDIVPTQCFDSINKYISLNKFKQTYVVTSRKCRKSAEDLIFSAFNKNLPIITTNNENKYLAIEENSVYFEDNKDAILGVINNRKNVLIIVPKWPWNLDIPNSKNIIHIEPEKFSNIGELIENKKEIINGK